MTDRRGVPVRGGDHNQADHTVTARMRYPDSLSDAHLIVKVIEDHPTRGMACLCGAPIGDTVDVRWHLANQIAAALHATGRTAREVAR